MRNQSKSGKLVKKLPRNGFVERRRFCNKTKMPYQIFVNKLCTVVVVVAVAAWRRY